jgi:hypothetical protein
MLCQVLLFVFYLEDFKFVFNVWLWFEGFISSVSIAYCFCNLVKEFGLSNMFKLLSLIYFSV